MNIATLARFLFTGSAEAIRAIAASRGALWVALAFVLSAGLAREYDGEYLPAKPWVLLIPFAASIGLSLLLYSTFWLLARRSNGVRRPAFLASYRMFATVFLMTAPLAWLYAIPYERFLSPLGATSANLWTLALVAFWRVVLTMQIARTLFGVGPVYTAPVLLTAACAGVLVVLSVASTPIFQLMGGIRYAPRDQMLASISFSMTVLSALSLPFLAIAALTLLRLANADWPMEQMPTRAVGVSGSLIVLACLSITIWLPILPFTQAEQRLRHQVEQEIAARHFQEALATMSAHARRDFPPAWDPPPRFGYPSERESDAVELIAATLDHPAARWVAEIYADKFLAYAQSRMLPWRRAESQADSEDAKRFTATLQRLPRGEPWDSLRGEFREPAPPATTQEK